MKTDVITVEDIGIKLTPSQKLALKTLLTFARTSTGSMVLNGKAGTGKTFLVCCLVAVLAAEGRKVAVTATTHKAVQVLNRKFIAFQKLLPSDISMMGKLHFSTIHSLLKLTEWILDDGTKTFSNPNFEKTLMDIKQNRIDVILVDECSMVGKGQGSNKGLWQYITQITTIPVVFVGDINQLNPVGEQVSPTFSKVDRQIELVEPVRQALDNPILKFAYGVLQNKLLYDVADINSGGEGIIRTKAAIYKGHKEFEFSIDTIDLLNRLYLCEEYQLDSDFAKVVTYTNACAGSYNTQIRKLFYPDTYKDSLYLPGEKLVTKDVVKDALGVSQENIIIANNCELTVLDSKQSVAFVDDIKLNVYHLDVEFINSYGFEEKRTIQVIHESSFKDYVRCLELLRTFAEKQTDRHKRREAWRGYYKTKYLFAELTYSYALTCHMAQGSTFVNTVVDIANMRTCRINREIKRLIYTGVTRPSKLLYI